MRVIYIDGNNNAWLAHEIASSLGGGSTLLLMGLAHKLISQSELASDGNLLVIQEVACPEVGVTDVRKVSMVIHQGKITQHDILVTQRVNQLEPNYA